MFNNLKIKIKLLLSFGLLVILFLLVSIFLNFEMRSINKEYNELLIMANSEYASLKEACTLANELDANLYSLIVSYDSKDEYAENLKNLEDNISKFDAFLDEYMAFLVEGGWQEYIDNLTIVIEKYESYENVVSDVVICLSDNDLAEAKRLMMEESKKESAIFTGVLNTMFEDALGWYSGETLIISDASNSSILMSTIATILIIVFSIILAFVLSSVITKPITRITENAKQIANGALAINLAINSKDEIGELGRAFDKIVHSVSSITTSLSIVSAKFQEGDNKVRIDTTILKGEYLDVAEGINTILSSVVDDTLKITDCIDCFASGNFDVEIPKFPGEKKVATDRIGILQQNLRNINNEINMLILSVTDGKLSAKIDTNKYSGDWAKLLIGLNNVMDAVVGPINETVDVLQNISGGKLDLHMVGDYKGDFAKLKLSINDTILQLNQYIGDISYTLAELSSDNYNLSVTREYKGDFIPIKTGLNCIIDRINVVMASINTSADQVSLGAKMISESSMSLAQGATEQSGSVEELYSTIVAIAEQTKNSTQVAKKTNELALVSQKNAVRRNDDMKSMLIAMEGINKASRDISGVIKTIEDIAFQTNLLALNAAVEAARAGAHGKGFSVVAEEVRSLSVKSQNSVKETAELLDSALKKVDEGTNIAKHMALELNEIVASITEISSLVGAMDKAASNQEISIELVNVSIGQIAEVTQSNTATSEETASSAEQLSSQSEMLKNMVRKFELRQ